MKTTKEERDEWKRDLGISDTREALLIADIDELQADCDQSLFLAQKWSRRCDELQHETCQSDLEIVELRECLRLARAELRLYDLYDDGFEAFRRCEAALAEPEVEP